MSEDNAPVAVVAKRFLITEHAWEVCRKGFLLELGTRVANGKGLMTWWESVGQSGSELAPFFAQSNPTLRTLTALGAISELRDKTSLGEELLIVALSVGFSEDVSASDYGEYIDSSSS